jgi:hypothetical protein
MSRCRRAAGTLGGRCAGSGARQTAKHQTQVTDAPETKGLYRHFTIGRVDPWEGPQRSLVRPAQGGPEFALQGRLARLIFRSRIKGSSALRQLRCESQLLALLVLLLDRCDRVGADDHHHRIALRVLGSYHEGCRHDVDIGIPRLGQLGAQSAADMHSGLAVRVAVVNWALIAALLIAQGALTAGVALIARRAGVGVAFWAKAGVARPPARTNAQANLETGIMEALLESSRPKRSARNG